VLLVCFIFLQIMHVSPDTTPFFVGGWQLNNVGVKLTGHLSVH
jgi:hypothetical protein